MRCMRDARISGASRRRAPRARSPMLRVWHAQAEAQAGGAVLATVADVTRLAAIAGRASECGIAEAHAARRRELAGARSADALVTALAAASLAVPDRFLRGCMAAVPGQSRFAVHEAALTSVAALGADTRGSCAAVSGRAPSAVRRCGTRRRLRAARQLQRTEQQQARDTLNELSHSVPSYNTTQRFRAHTRALTVDRRG